jgi:hypothetical protein
MDVIDFTWNSFFVVLHAETDESRESYLSRALDCLKEFNKTYTSVNPPIDPFWPMEGSLELLTQEHNFCDMHLEMHCDVKYRVKPDGIGPNPPGIWVYSHRMESRKPQVAFLKEKWEEFDFP